MKLKIGTIALLTITSTAFAAGDIWFDEDNIGHIGDDHGRPHFHFQNNPSQGSGWNSNGTWYHWTRDANGGHGWDSNGNYFRWNEH